MKIEFSNNKYERSHMKTPKGRVYWGFECEGNEFWEYGTLSEAKQKVKKQIKALAPEDYKGVAVAYILP